MRISLLRKKTAPSCLNQRNSQLFTADFFVQWKTWPNWRGFFFCQKKVKHELRKKGADTQTNWKEWNRWKLYTEKNMGIIAYCFLSWQNLYNGAAPEDHKYNYTIPSSTWFALCPAPSTSQKQKSLDYPQISLKCCTPNPFPKKSPPFFLEVTCNHSLTTISHDGSVRPGVHLGVWSHLLTSEAGTLAYLGQVWRCWRMHRGCRE